MEKIIELERLKTNFEVLFLKKEIDICWEWKGTLSEEGYGFYYFTTKVSGLKRHRILAHRYSYELYKEKIPIGLVIDHICRNRSCVNPLHLRCVTRKVNSTENSISPCAKNKLKTHCKRGHLFDEKNTNFERNKNNEIVGRHCSFCQNANARRRYRIRKGLFFYN